MAARTMTNGAELPDAHFKSGLTALWAFSRLLVDLRTADVMLSSATALPLKVSTMRPREKIATRF